MITGAGSTDAVATFTVAETSVGVTRSAAVATSTAEAEEVSTVDTEAVDPMAAVMAVDTGKFLNSSTPQTAGSTLCRPFPFWFERGAKPAMRNAFAVAT
jgi:hypothetical protein